jgi:magnesium-transporting ATPase (P-type)
MQRDSSSAESPLSSVGGLQGLLSALRSSATNGIEASETDMSNRRELYGTNEVAKRSEQSFLNIVKDAANDSTLWILCSSGAISLVLGALFENDSSNGWLEGASILGAVVIIVGVTAANNYQKEREFASLNEESDAALAVRAIRGSSELSLPTRSLVVGDVVLCEGGDVIPADGVLLEGLSHQALP